jgi:hypothetical protein
LAIERIGDGRAAALNVRRLVRRHVHSNAEQYLGQARGVFSSGPGPQTTTATGHGLNTVLSDDRQRLGNHRWRLSWWQQSGRR